MFDPSIIRYDELLDLFWQSHNPAMKSPFGKRQYMSLLLYDNDEQKEKAQASKTEMEKKLGETIQTEIQTRSTFYTAEDYHQKYFLRRYKKAVQTLSALYPDEASFRDSTVTARLNGFVRGRSSMKELKREIESWGWSPEQTHRTFQVLDAVRW